MAALPEFLLLCFLLGFSCMSESVIGYRDLSYTDTHSGLISVPSAVIPVNVEVIDLSYNNLTCLSRGDFINHTELLSFVADYNMIENIEPDAFRDTKLTTLSLRYNNITCLPLFTGVNLISLLLESNHLHRCESHDMHNFSTLTELDLRGTGLDDVGLERFIFHAQSLIKLRGGDNHLSALPGPLSPFLQILKVENNFIDSLDHLNGVPELSELWISNNKLSSIGSNTFNNTLLRQVIIQRNELTCIPNLIGIRKTLFKLNLSGNRQIEDFCSQEAGSVVFESLVDLRLNRVTLLDIPILNATKLERLFVQSNHIEVIPIEITEIYPELRELDIKKNPLACTCNNSWIKQVNTSILQILLSEDYTCPAHGPFGGKFWANLTEEQLCAGETTPAYQVNFTSATKSSTEYKNRIEFSSQVLETLKTDNVTTDSIVKTDNVTIDSTTMEYYNRPTGYLAWITWTEWTQCSVTCGAGNKQRFRLAHMTNSSGNYRILNRHIFYSMQNIGCSRVCTTWLEWTVGPCSAVCGEGYMRVSRDCSARNCKGMDHYFINCEQNCNSTANSSDIKEDLSFAWDSAAFKESDNRKTAIATGSVWILTFFIHVLLIVYLDLIHLRNCSRILVRDEVRPTKLPFNRNSINMMFLQDSQQLE